MQRCWQRATCKLQYFENCCSVSLIQDNDHLRIIFSLLTGKQINAACQVAQSNGDSRLSLLLAQSSGNMILRQWLLKQLDDWLEHKVCSRSISKPCNLSLTISNIWLSVGRCRITNLYGFEWQQKVLWSLISFASWRDSQVCFTRNLSSLFYVTRFCFCVQWEIRMFSLDKFQGRDMTKYDLTKRNFQFLVLHRNCQ